MQVFPLIKRVVEMSGVGGSPSFVPVSFQLSLSLSPLPRTVSFQKFPNCYSPNPLQTSQDWSLHSFFELFVCFFLGGARFGLLGFLLFWLLTLLSNSFDTNFCITSFILKGLLYSFLGTRILRIYRISIVKINSRIDY